LLGGAQAARIGRIRAEPLLSGYTPVKFHDSRVRRVLGV
jgi:hypothetical protein